ncbi:MAG: efflux RND transporter periplasmic adaptor subunit [Myxococcales bacterium]|nr:efflux RND transporter periplasmic adaptor subunit [Myxococcales bacterium]
MKRQRLLVWSLMFALLVVIGSVCWYCQASGAPKVLYQLSKVDRGDIAAKVTASGTVSALVTVEVGSQVSGRIQTLLVDYNSPVKKGQVLATIDPQLFQAAVEQSSANHTAAEARLTQATVAAQEAERLYRRTRDLAENKLASTADLETAEASWNKAKAEVAAVKAELKQANAALHQALVNLEYTRIVSPIDGVVISRDIDLGQTVAASFQAPVLFTIAEDLRRMQVDANVAEADVGKLKAGMAAQFIVDAFPETPFQGIVRQVRLAPQTNQNVVTYDAVVDVKNDPPKLMPGMTANVTFVYDERKNVLRIPNTALRYRPAADEKVASTGHAAAAEGNAGSSDCDGDCRSLWVLRRQLPEAVRVQLGLSDGAYTEIVKGELHEGDQLITGKIGEEKSKSADKGANHGGPPRPF